MLTIFATPKPFRGHIGVIQRNAIQSWARLQPRPDIVLLGSEEGTAAAAAELDARHIAEVPRNRWGTPLVRGLFQAAENTSAYNTLCYVNSDIVLMSDFAAAVALATRRRRRFLMIGHRWNLEVPAPIRFENPEWETEFRQRAIAAAVQDTPDGVDYFVFTRGLWGRIPDLAIGRCAWDDWLVLRARQRLASVIDATGAVMAVHQQHDYGSFGSYQQVLESEEGRLNRSLAGEGLMTIRDATSRLSGGSVVANWDFQTVFWHLKRLRMLHPKLGPLVSRAGIRVLSGLKGTPLLPLLIRLHESRNRADV